ncbi:MAG: DUF5998 family protein [Nocardioidaceae bacterium]
MVDRYVQEDRWKDLRDEIQQTGYYPDVVAEGMSDALASEAVEAYVLHHEPTFDREEIRRHLTVLAMTGSRLVLTHTDEHPPDDLLPEPYTSTTTEAVPLRAVTSVVTTRMIATGPASADAGGPAREAVMTIGWGSVSRLDLEPAQCSDPSCDADHGYSGNITGDDFTLRISATADGDDAVARLLDFGRRLSAATAGG